MLPGPPDDCSLFVGPTLYILTGNKGAHLFLLRTTRFDARLDWRAVLWTKRSFFINGTLNGKSWSAPRYLPCCHYFSPGSKPDGIGEEEGFFYAKCGLSTSASWDVARFFCTDSWHRNEWEVLVAPAAGAGWNRFSDCFSCCQCSRPYHTQCHIHVLSIRKERKLNCLSVSVSVCLCVCLCVCVCVCKWNSYVDILRAYAIWRIYILMDIINGRHWTALMDGINGWH